MSARTAAAAQRAAVSKAAVSKAAVSKGAPADTMMAVVQDRYGSTDRLRVERIARPHPAPSEVLLRVHAAGLDRGTWHLMTGRPYMMRLVLGFRGPKDRVPGRDVAGVVTAVGSAVTRFAVGDRVFGIGRGSFAEYAVVNEDKLAAMPSGLSFEQAAVIPISAGTASQALRDVGRVQAGQHVLVLGASGGVGSYAVQIAKALGAEVTGVSSAAKRDFVRSLGADHVLDYAAQDFADGPQRYDLIIDLGGNPSVRRLRRALTRTGTAVIAGGEEGGNLTGGIGRQLRALAVSAVTRQRLTMFVAKERSADLVALTELLEAGTVVPRVDRTYALDEAADAMRYLSAGSARGKVAISLSPTVVLPQ
jgi:NADPH:quinone reductase-like Zn-dependent oxidoreductase